MRRLSALLCVALLASGCSLLFGPDRSQIMHDRDGAVPPDAGPDARVDASDAGDPDACAGGERLEVSCMDGVDNDCDGLVDCFDFDCRSEDHCCTGGSAVGTCLNSTLPVVGFTEQPPLGELEYSSSMDCADRYITRFSTGPGPTRGLVSRSCQPVNFGMTYTVSFRFSSPCAMPCERPDYAALAFGIGELIPDGSEYPHEFRFVFRPDGSAFAEETGPVVGVVAGPLTFMPVTPIQLTVRLDPGPDEDRIDVLFVTATAFQMGGASHTFLDRVPLMPLIDVVCTNGEIGLRAVVEGTGDLMHVDVGINREERGCASPGQFQPPSVVPDLSVPEGCDVGGAGSPVLINYCHTDCGVGGAPQVQWDLWTDASTLPRHNDILGYVDFGTCGYVGLTNGFPDGGATAWEARASTDPTYLWPISAGAGAREPTLLAETGVDFSAVDDLWYAYARRETEGVDEFTIWGGRVRRDRSQMVEPRARILDPSMAPGCIALRDPLLVADYTGSADAFAVEGAFLLFTCDRDGVPDTIGMARVMLESDGTIVVDGTVETSWLTNDVGAYAFRGVSTPEGFTEASGTGLTLRLWFLARGPGVQQTLAFAQGRGPIGSGLPSVTPYPANPILTNESPLLQAGCVGVQCRMTDLSVTPIFNNDDEYQFLFARERIADTSVTYDFLPLVQPRPMD